MKFLLLSNNQPLSVWTALKWICLLLVVFLTVELQAQLTIQGKIKHEESGIDFASVSVYRKGKRLRTTPAKPNGDYKLKLAYGQQFVLQFNRPNMVPIKVMVLTEVPYGTTNIEPVVVNMTMFDHYEGMDISFLDDPVTIIKYVGTEETQFGADTDMMREKLERLQRAIEDMKQQEAKSLAALEEEKKEAVSEPVAEDTVAEEVVVPDPGIERQPDPSTPKTITTDTRTENTEIARKVAMENKRKQADSNRDVKTVYENQLLEMSAEAARGDKTAQQEKGEMERQADLERFKRDQLLRSERDRMVEETIQREAEIEKNRLTKQEWVNDIVEIAAEEQRMRSVQKQQESDTIDAERFILPQQKHYKTQTFISKTETTELIFPGRVVTYRKETYNMLFFDINYYYRDGVEIDASEYQQELSQYSESYEE